MCLVFTTFHHLSNFLFFFFNDPPPTEISTLPLHDALPISDRLGRMRRLATLLVCAASALFAGVSAASAAAPVQIQLPVVGLGLPGQPPLVSRSSGAQGFYLGKLRVRERVVVDVDRGGAPTTVRVVHRIALRGKGDYRLVVPGP